MGALDLFWEIIFLVGGLAIILLCSKVKKTKRSKSSKLPFNILIAVAIILMAFRLITWFV